MTINLVLALRGGLTVRVNDLSQTTTEYEMQPGDTVAELKRMVEEQSGLPSEHTIAMYAGEPLDDSRTMSHYCARGNASRLDIYLTLQI